MTVRPYVTFQDTRTSAVGDDRDIREAPPPGRELAEDLARGLQAGGLTLAFPVSQWEAYGWEFTVETGGRRVWFMLQASDDWLLITDTPRGFLEKLRGATFEEQHGKALAILASVLAPPRFTNVRWFTKDEFRAPEPGKPAP